jgi:hypothetical protein
MTSTKDLELSPAAPVESPPYTSRGLTLLMSVGCAISVANMYYCQPLLAQMGASVPGGQRVASYIPTFTQVGTMLGMGLFVPLGDMFERRRLSSPFHLLWPVPPFLTRLLRMRPGSRLPGLLWV